jgi:hypothetical protein
MRLLKVQHGHSLNQFPLSEATNDGHAHLYEFSRFWSDLDQIIDPVVLLGKNLTILLFCMPLNYAKKPPPVRKAKTWSCVRDNVAVFLAILSQNETDCEATQVRIGVAVRDIFVSCATARFHD